MSTAMIGFAQASAEPAISAAPTPPQPMTATDFPRVTAPVLIAAARSRPLSAHFGAWDAHQVSIRIAAAVGIAKVFRRMRSGDLRDDLVEKRGAKRQPAGWLAGAPAGQHADAAHDQRMERLYREHILKEKAQEPVISVASLRAKPKTTVNA